MLISSNFSITYVFYHISFMIYVELFIGCMQHQKLYKHIIRAIPLNPWKRGLGIERIMCLYHFFRSLFSFHVSLLKDVRGFCLPCWYVLSRLCSDINLTARTDTYILLWNEALLWAKYSSWSIAKKCVRFSFLEVE